MPAIRSRAPRRRLVAVPLALAGAALAGCAAETAVPPTPTRSSAPSDDAPVFVQPAGDPAVVADGLQIPWDLLRLGTGELLVSERDSARILRIDETTGDTAEVGVVDGVAPGGEGGLLGIAELDDGGERWLYAYLTAAGDNRIVRMPLTGSGELALGAPQLVLDGLAKAGNHDGGRIDFGPDGMLYATVGDAGDPSRAQDPASPNGKILRMTPTGGVPDDNPTPGSLVYSLGHRNPQGIAWDDTGQLYAAEFGQDTWDEFNRIEPGGNYGWPTVEGVGEQDGFVDPLAQWSTDAASPSGLAFVDGTFFLAGLGGERVWAIYPADLSSPWSAADEASGVEWFAGQFGRIRDVAAGPDGTLLFLTNNTDGRGDPREGDDHLYSVRLTELVEG